MKPTEAAALLAVAAAFDNRKPDADQAKVWAMSLDGLRFEDCRDVIVSHYRTTRDWLMPSDIVGGVKRLRAKRLDDFGPIPAPRGIDPDDKVAWRRYVLETQTAIADGTLLPDAEPAQVGPHRDVIAELGHIGHEIPRDERMSTDTALQAARAALVAAKGAEIEPTEEIA